MGSLITIVRGYIVKRVLKTYAEDGPFSKTLISLLRRLPSKVSIKA